MVLSTGTTSSAKPEPRRLYKVCVSTVATSLIASPMIARLVFFVVCFVNGASSMAFSANQFMMAPQCQASGITPSQRLMSSAPATTTNVKLLRRLSSHDQEIIWEVLKHAAHETKDVRNLDVLKPYGQHFGLLPGDLGVGAFLQRDEKNGDEQDLLLGAAWIRRIHNRGGFCQTEEKLPELAMAVLPKYQSQGIGSQLLERLIHEVTNDQLSSLSNNSARGICLSCRTTNSEALKLYKKFGFVEIPNSAISNRAGGTSISMALRFSQPTQRDVVVRPATANDVSTILEMIRKNAAYDFSIGGTSSPSDLKVTEERILESLFPNSNNTIPPYGYILLAEAPDPLNEQQMLVVGFASYYFRYSTFAGRPNLWLDDLYVDETFRSQGIGSAIMHKLSKEIAVQHKCTHVGWFANRKNERGLEFYNRLGAKQVGNQGDRLLYKFDVDS